MCCASLDTAEGRCHADTDRSDARGVRAGRALTMTVGLPTVWHAKNGMPPARAGGIGLLETPSSPTPVA